MGEEEEEEGILYLVGVGLDQRSTQSLGDLLLLFEGFLAGSTIGVELAEACKENETAQGSASRVENQFLQEASIRNSHGDSAFKALIFFRYKPLFCPKKKKKKTKKEQAFICLWMNGFCFDTKGIVACTKVRFDLYTNMMQQKGCNLGWAMHVLVHNKLHLSPGLCRFGLL